MIRRIEIVNFMSHARTVIEPADGLTVLVGPNNCGKSAVVAALQILCHNDNSTYVMRHDQKECAVTVETADGHTVTWKRNKASPKYEIDGQAFDRLPRGGVPDALHAVLRMPRVAADGGHEFDVHFGEQKSPLFLIDKPGSHAAQFFASSSDAAKFVEMQRRHSAKMANARRDRAVEQTKAEQLATSLAALGPVDALSTAVEQLERQHAEVARSAEAIRRLAADLAELRQADRHRRDCARKAIALAALQTPPALPDAAPLLAHVQDARQTAAACDAYAGRAAALKPLTPPPDVDEEHALATLVDALCTQARVAGRAAAACRAARPLASPPLLKADGELRQSVGAIVWQQDAVERDRRRAATLAGLAPIPTLADVTTPAALVRAIAASAAGARSLGAACRSLAALAPAPVPAPTADLRQCVLEMARAAKALQSCRAAAAAAANDSDDAVAALRHWAGRQPACPTCGGPVDADRLIARNAAAGVTRA